MSTPTVNKTATSTTNHNKNISLQYLKSRGLHTHTSKGKSKIVNPNCTHAHNIRSCNANGIAVICFSKDRPFQLQQYLLTLFAYVFRVNTGITGTFTKTLSNTNNTATTEVLHLLCEVTVIWSCTKPFTRSYDSLIQRFPRVHFVLVPISYVDRMSVIIVTICLQ